MPLHHLVVVGLEFALAPVVHVDLLAHGQVAQLAGFLLVFEFLGHFVKLLEALGEFLQLQVVLLKLHFELYSLLLQLAALDLLLLLQVAHGLELVPHNLFELVLDLEELEVALDEGRRLLVQVAAPDTFYAAVHLLQIEVYVAHVLARVQRIDYFSAVLVSALLSL